MSPLDLRQLLVDWTVKNSGFEDRRYLGMSHISQCPLQLYREIILGPHSNVNGKLKCYEGYLAERDMKSRLSALGIYVEVNTEIVAGFNSRYRGHVDGELGKTGKMLEIKSTMDDKISQFVKDMRIPDHHYEQAQAYMRHSRKYYDSTMFIYKARDTGRIFTYEVRINEEVGERLDEKAKRILACVDKKEPPACECGRCR